MYKIHTRPATKEEARAIAWLTSRAELGCTGVILLTFFFTLGGIGGCVGGWISDDAGAVGRWIGYGLAGLLFGSIFFGIFFLHDRYRAKALRDKAEGLVQEISVTEARVIEIGLINNHAPIFAFQIGLDKILFLQGQWLHDYMYGDAIIDDPDPVFPTATFTITRLPHTGHVLKITVEGPYLASEKEVEALRYEYEFGDSELLDGSIDNIADVLKREHERRMAVPTHRENA